MITAPRQGERVTQPCIICKRPPCHGETFGPHAEGWDFTGICPECWDKETVEPEEEEEDSDGE